jgi:methyl-accepting chemotaxis protein
MFDQLRNMPVAVKVALAPLFAIVCLAVIAGLGWLANHQLSDALAGVGEQRLPHALQASDLALHLATVHGMVNQSLAWEGAGINTESIEKLDKEIGASLKAYEQALSRAVADPAITPGRKEALQSILRTFAKYKQNALDALDIKSGMVANAASYMTTMDTIYAEVRTALGRVVYEESELSTQAVSEARSIAADNSLLVACCFAVCLVASTLLSWLMSRLILLPLADASRVALAVAGGDLSARPAAAASSDATGRVLSALGQVAQGLSVIVENIRKTAQEVSVATTQIGSGTAD